MPLLAILLPAKAQALDAGSAPAVVSATALAGAAVASVVNLVVGWLSDRTGHGFARRGWALGGVAAICAGYGLIGFARTPGELLAAVLLLQVAINCTLAPLMVLIAERFFRRPNGFVVGVGGASQPAASFLGAAVVATLIPYGVAAYVVVGLLTAAMVVPFVLTARRPGDSATRPAPALAPLLGDEPPEPPPPRRADLLRLWSWRFALQLTASLSAPYALFRLREAQAGVGGGATRGAVGLTLDISLLTLVASGAHLVAAIATAGAVARGLSRRDAARLAALMLAAAMAVFVLAHGATSFVVAFLCMGLGSGAGQAADMQLALGLLPSRRTLGRDLGLLNLANTLPQMVAPLIALAAPGVRQGRVGVLFALAALSSLLAAAIAGGLTRRAAQPGPVPGSV